MFVSRRGNAGERGSTSREFCARELNGAREAFLTIREHFSIVLLFYTKPREVWEKVRWRFDTRAWSHRVTALGFGGLLRARAHTHTHTHAPHIHHFTLSRRNGITHNSTHTLLLRCVPLLTRNEETRRGIVKAVCSALISPADEATIFVACTARRRPALSAVHAVLRRARRISPAPSRTQ